MPGRSKFVVVKLLDVLDLGTLRIFRQPVLFGGK